MQFTVISRVLDDNYGRVPYYNIDLQGNDNQTLTIRCTVDEGKELSVGTVLELKVCYH